VRNRGIGRARMFVGAMVLFAAVIAWGTSFLMSPHGETVAQGTEHVRTTVVVFMRNSAIGTLILCALAAWLLFPTRRPRWPQRDYAILGVIALLVVSSIYDLIWLQTSVLH
jgi:drug/metabolite transporter (DMT)-like permease